MAAPEPGLIIIDSLASVFETESVSQSKLSGRRMNANASEEALLGRYGIRSEVVGLDGVRFVEEYASSTPGTYAQVLEKLREQGKSYPWVVIVSSGNE